MSVLRVRSVRFTGICLLLFLSLLSACRQESKTKTAAASVDTTVVDDDTLEVRNTPTPAARAR